MNPTRSEFIVHVCPECGLREDHYNDDAERRPTTYCLQHEAEAGRKERPAHVPLEVVPKALLDGVEATLDALLNGLDNYRTREIPGTGISADLRELVDTANESRNAIRKATPS